MTDLKIALQRIEECRRTRSIELDLSKLELTEIPEQVFELSWLQKLDISGEYGKRSISSIPTAIAQLKGLKEFDCSQNKIRNLFSLSKLEQLISLCFNRNQINTLSPLSKLKQLTSLEFADNKISNLSPLSKLYKLTSLEYAGNQISDLSPLSKLNKLTFLAGWGNKISDLSPLSKLRQLSILNCGDNKINDLSPLLNLEQLTNLVCAYNQITDISPIYTFIIKGQYSGMLNLSGNPLTGIPQELLGKNFLDNCQPQLQAYFLDKQKAQAKKQQIKVQFIGNGRVGKTTLAYALEHKKAPDEAFKSTHGIVIKSISQPVDGLDDPATLQLWDFGGQEIYHATHRLFLSSDSLYLLLWAEETDEHKDEVRHPVIYWLEAIHDLAPNSPVILVKNQIDRSDNLGTEPAELNEDIPGFGQIHHAVKISTMQYKGLPVLRGAIEEVLLELKDKLEVSLPMSWLDISDELESRREKKAIPFAHFQQLCAKAGVSNAKVLVEYLHNTGVVFYKEGAFQDQVILDQNWVINAVYRLFDPKGKRDLLEKRMHGCFNGRDAGIFWQDVETSEHEIYLSFMKNCGICYEPDYEYVKDLAEREFIVPALLPENSPAQEAWNPSSDDCLYEVEYPFLHRSIIERLIIKLGETYQGKPWRHGIFCTIDNTKLLLKCQRQASKGKLCFHLQGDKAADLIAKLQKIISEISPHKRYVEYLNSKDGDRSLLSSLKSLAKQGDHKLVADILLASRENKADETKMPAKKVSLFISYSHADEKPYKEELELCLKGIARKLPLEYWDDRQIFAGELVDTQIMERLEPADIVVLLISRNFFASDYCFSIEMEKALKQFEQGNNIVIPIIIRETDDWHSFEIGKITALPTDGKALSQWDDEDAFWADVQKGIRLQVVSLLQTPLSLIS